MIIIVFFSQLSLCSNDEVGFSGGEKNNSQSTALQSHAGIGNEDSLHSCALPVELSSQKQCTEHTVNGIPGSTDNKLSGLQKRVVAESDHAFVNVGGDDSTENIQCQHENVRVNPSSSRRGSLAGRGQRISFFPDDDDIGRENAATCNYSFFSGNDNSIRRSSSYHFSGIGEHNDLNSNASAAPTATGRGLSIDEIRGRYNELPEGIKAIMSIDEFGLIQNSVANVTQQQFSDFVIRKRLLFPDRKCWTILCYTKRSAEIIDAFANAGLMILPTIFNTFKDELSHEVTSYMIGVCGVIKIAANLLKASMGKRIIRESECLFIKIAETATNLAEIEKSAVNEQRPRELWSCFITMLLLLWGLD